MNNDKVFRTLTVDMQYILIGFNQYYVILLRRDKLSYMLHHPSHGEYMEYDTSIYGIYVTVRVT